ncbi:hypothetical protein JCM19233_2452 [Vibrio astriarenae]|nr:hypothetical protein JCM19233_2452 [Vibrio sp. C7]
MSQLTLNQILRHANPHRDFVHELRQIFREGLNFHKGL